MKNNSQRVMAYQFAKTLSEEEVQQISGGMGATQRPSVQVSGSGGLGSLDGTIDFIWDF